MIFVYIGQLITYLDAHNGSIIAILTCILVFVNILYAIYQYKITKLHEKEKKSHVILKIAHDIIIPMKKRLEEIHNLLKSNNIITRKDITERENWDYFNVKFDFNEYWLRGNAVYLNNYNEKIFNEYRDFIIRKVKNLDFSNLKAYVNDLMRNIPDKFSIEANRLFNEGKNNYYNDPPTKIRIEEFIIAIYKNLTTLKNEEIDRKNFWDYNRTTLKNLLFEFYPELQEKSDNLSKEKYQLENDINEVVSKLNEMIEKWVNEYDIVFETESW